MNDYSLILTRKKKSLDKPDENIPYDHAMPWHYGHFIHDVVIPFSHIYLEKLNKGEKIIHTYLSSNKNQTIGTFKKHFELIFDVIHEEIPEENITEKIIYLDTYLFGPYPEMYSLPLKKHIYNKFKLNLNKPNLIVLIKRGTAELRFNHTTGSERRQISNQDDLFLSLKKKYENTIEVELESLDMYQQLQLFSKTKCLIGIHGAGMVNSIWLPDYSLVIECKHNHMPNSIQNLAYSSNCYYEKVNLEKNNLIDVDKILNILSAEYL